MHARTRGPNLFFSIDLHLPFPIFWPREGFLMLRTFMRAVCLLALFTTPLLAQQGNFTVRELDTLLNQDADTITLPAGPWCDMYIWTLLVPDDETGDSATYTIYWEASANFDNGWIMWDSTTNLAADSAIGTTYLLDTAWITDPPAFRYLRARIQGRAGNDTSQIEVVATYRKCP